MFPIDEHKTHAIIMQKMVQFKINKNNECKNELKPKNLLHMDFLVAIPVGIKTYIFFDTMDTLQGYIIQMLPMKIQTFKINNSTKVEFKHLDSLLLYGTMFFVKNSTIPFFAIEDIYQHFQSMNICWKQKLSILHNLFKSNLLQKCQQSFICGLPVMALNMSALNYAVKQLPYTIQEIQFKKYNQINHYYYIPYKYSSQIEIPTQKQFWVQATVTPDIYHLYSYFQQIPNSNVNSQLNKSNNNYKPIDKVVALVPDYQTSKKLNSLFRNIKENQNLDALEESDEEEEFQNVSSDKYLKNTILKMNCIYSSKFKKWIPDSCVDKL